MLSLYRSGRQAEVLAAYRALREAPVDQLGIDPSPELQRLEQAILGQDPGLAAPGFLVRDDELATLARLLDEHRLVTLTGPGGVGQTAHLGAAARCLEGLAGCAAARGNPAPAAALLEPASAARTAAGTPPTAVDRSDIERTLRTTGESLDEATWQQAFRRGEAVTPDEVATPSSLRPGLVDK
jgi:hypothetical protein